MQYRKNLVFLRCKIIQVNIKKIVDKFFKDSEFKDVVTPLACPSHLRGDVGFKEMGEVYELESLLKIGSEV